MTEDSIKTTLAFVTEKMAAQPIETQRLALRRYEPKDFSDHYEYRAQKELCRLCGMDAPKSEAEAREWFEREQLAQPNRFAVVLKENEKVIGFFSLGVYPFLLSDEALADKRGVSLSFGINESYQRRGLMSELLTAAIEYFFAVCELDFVNCGYFDFNEGSKRVQQKAGMRRYIDHEYEYGGVRIRVEEMIIHRGEWKRID